MDMVLVLGGLVVHLLGRDVALVLGAPLTSAGHAGVVGGLVMAGIS